jgi:tRNA dimethylallyltransferase
MIDLHDIPVDRPILIAGPTASGKSALALAIASAQGGVIVNADALQVFDGWRILTARPDAADLARAPHALYGHVPFDAPYSVGQWLRDVTPLLAGVQRPIIVGGTGLNFAALTGGLADIPPTPGAIRDLANALPLAAMLAALDPETSAGLDIANRARVQRAYEVLQATGRRIVDWQAETPAPLLSLEQATALVVQVDPGLLNARIAARFDAMLAAGLLDEARAMLPGWNSYHGSSKAIGAADLIAHLRGHITMDAARDAAITASRQYAKRQRTWFRKRMHNWQVIHRVQTE